MINGTAQLYYTAYSHTIYTHSPCLTLSTIKPSFLQLPTRPKDNTLNKYMGSSSSDSDSSSGHGHGHGGHHGYPGVHGTPGGYGGAYYVPGAHHGEHKKKDKKDKKHKKDKKDKDKHKEGHGSSSHGIGIPGVAVPHGAPVPGFPGAPAAHGYPAPGPHGAPGGHAQQFFGAAPGGYPAPGAHGAAPGGYPAPGAHGAPAPYGAPSPYGAPAHGAPAPYGAPAHGAPSPYGAPAHGAPGYGAPHGHDRSLPAPGLPGAVPGVVAGAHGAPGVPPAHPGGAPPPSGFRVPLNVGQPFPPAPQGGTPVASDADGSPLFLGSAILGASVHPCKIGPHLHPPARVPYGGGEYEHNGRYDLLPFDPNTMEWVWTEKGRIPPGRRPIEGGYEEHGGKLYHALGKIHGLQVPGKCGEHLVRIH